MDDDTVFQADDDVLVVHAHPDDEVFCTGAAILTAKTAGARVRLRVFTGGEGRSAALTRAALADAREHRAAIVTAACAHLGLDDWAYVTAPGQWTDTPQRPESTMAAASPDDLAGAMVRLLEKEQPTVVLTVGPDGVTGHPDHIACHRAVASAVMRSAWTPRLTMGAVVDNQHVEAAQQQAQRLFGTAVGSGGVRGVSTRNAQVVIAPARGERQRKLALDAYAPGLGTSPAEDLAKSGHRLGDSVLLRLTLDIAGWDIDRFLPLPPGAADTSAAARGDDQCATCLRRVGRPVRT